MVNVFVIGGGLVALLVIAYLVGWFIESIVTGDLFQPSRRRDLQQAQIAREARVISDGIRVKRMLDSQAFAAQQEMLRVAQELARQHAARRYHITAAGPMTRYEPARMSK